MSKQLFLDVERRELTAASVEAGGCFGVAGSARLGKEHTPHCFPKSRPESEVDLNYLEITFCDPYCPSLQSPRVILCVPNQVCARVCLPVCSQGCVLACVHSQMGVLVFVQYVLEGVCEDLHTSWGRGFHIHHILPPLSMGSSHRHLLLHSLPKH